jgi:exodeoxyribonuclease-5
MDNPIIRISSFIRSNDYTNLKYGKFSEDVYKIKFNFDDFDYLVDRVDLFKSEVICLCYTNISRKKLNNKIREKKSFNIETPYPGEKLICLKNNKNLGIYNGEIGTCVYSLFKDKDILDIFIDFEDKSFSLDVSSIIFSDKEHKINLIELYRKNSNNKKNVCYFDFGYTITVHKSQGSSWEKVIVLDQKENYFKNKELYKRWLYTAITRSKQKLLILSNI